MLLAPGEATRVSTSKTWILDNGRSGKALGVRFFLGSGLVMDMMGFWWILDGFWMGFGWDFDGFLLRLLLRVCRMATCFFYYLPWHLSNGIETINQSQPLLRVQFFFFSEKLQLGVSLVGKAFGLLAAGHPGFYTCFSADDTYTIDMYATAKQVYIICIWAVLEYTPMCFNTCN